MNESFPLIYTILSVGVIVCLFLRRTKLGALSILVLSLMMAVVAIFRGQYVGTDYENYIYIFNHTNSLHVTDNTGNPVDVGFAAFILLFKSLGFNYIAFYGVTYLILFCGLFRYIRFIKADIAFSLFFFYFLGYYFDSFNIVRQVMIIGFVLFFIPLLYKKKYIQFLVVVVIACLFHKTAILCVLLVPIFILSQKGRINKTILAVGLVLSYGVYYIGTTYFYKYMALLMTYFSMTDSYGQYVANGELRQEIGNLTSTAYTLFALILLFCKSNKSYKFETNVVVLSYAFFNLGNLLMNQGIRIFLWFNVFVLALLPIMFQDKDTKYRKLFIVVSIIMSLSLFVVQYYLGNNNEIKPYYMAIQ